jgi:hypothetical protein
MRRIKKKKMKQLTAEAVGRQDKHGLAAGFALRLTRRTCPARNAARGDISYYLCTYG